MQTRFTEIQLRNAVLNSHSIANVCRLLNIAPAGGNYTTIKNYLKKWSICTDHFTRQGWSKGKTFGPKRTLDSILVENSNCQSHKLKLRLFKENVKQKRCEVCHRKEWLGRNIPLELHHINGINTDNRLGNLQILCPNCHALTDNYRGKNIGSSRKKLLDSNVSNSVNA